MSRQRILTDITCEHCSTVFRPKASDQRYCSVQCHYEKRREPNATCPKCGVEFKRVGKQKYCGYECANASFRVDRSVICERCGTSFVRPHGKYPRFCSKSCVQLGRVRVGQGVLPRGTKRPHMSGYVLVSTDKGWELEHRLVMSEVLQRPVADWERVHHRNGDRADNRPENLEMWTLRHKDPAGVRLADLPAPHCVTCSC